MTQCLYLYGMVDGLIDRGLLIGAERGPELDLTCVGRVAAVHSTVDSRDFADLQPELDEGSRFAELVRQHDEVVTALALAGPVLPARLGTLLPSRDAVTRLLEGGHASLADALDRIRGHAEWRLDVQCAQSTEVATAEVASGTAYLQARRAARDNTEKLRAQLRNAIESLDEALTFFADEATRLQIGNTGLSARRAYLVPDSVQQSFVAAVEQGAADLDGNGCSVRVIGPLPAYSFADLELGSPAA
jgi:Gas vesicle synthesis protein GvpL/GvpF